MHSVKLALVSALLVAGCAADDHLGVGTGAADPSLSAAVAKNGTATARTATAPDLAAESTASTSATASNTAEETTALTHTTTPADTTSETATTTPAPTTTPADTPPEATAAPAAPATETTTTGTPTTAVRSTAPADTPSPTSTTTAVTTTVPDSAVTTTAPSQPPIDGFTVFYEATCDACHGASGQGGSGADLSASTLNIETMIEVIRFGVPDTQMEGWDFEPKPPGLTEEEIEAVAVYVMSLRGR